MLFETLKTKCASFAYNNGLTEWGVLATITNVENVINGGKFQRSVTIIKELKDKVWEEIMRTDIRNVKVLCEAFPTVVPDFIKNGNYSIEYTDKGWKLINTSN